MAFLIEMSVPSSRKAQQLQSAFELARSMSREFALEHWKTADEYLSGEVVHKLRVVQKLRRPDLAVNVARLQAAQPQPLGPGEIRIKLGAPWIPTEVIQQFAVELLSR